MKSVRLLLCRPEGGLNDMLCQIEKACLYAETYNRIVIVETDYHGAFTGFSDAFSNYFISMQSTLVLNSNEYRELFDTIDVVPNIVHGIVNCYISQFDKTFNNFVDQDTGSLLSFDFTKDYAEQLLLHHACGGGEASSGALSRMRVHDRIIDALLERIRTIGGAYDALHIRDTDYKSNYQTSVEELKETLSRPLFVATDNRDALEFCKSVLGAHRVYSFSELPIEAGSPLHSTPARSSPYERNKDAILDLIMLAIATEYKFVLVTGVDFLSGFSGVSGFSKLAHNLRNSPVLTQLVARPHPIVSMDSHRLMVTKINDDMCYLTNSEIAARIARKDAEIAEYIYHLDRINASPWWRLGMRLTGLFRALLRLIRKDKRNDADPSANSV